MKLGSSDVSAVYLGSNEISQIYLGTNDVYSAGGAAYVTDGLALYLDANDPASYPGSGTTISDLSGNGADATINGALPYVAGSPSYFDFGTAIGSPYRIAPIGAGNTALQTLDDFTIEFWINPSAYGGGNTKTIYMLNQNASWGTPYPSIWLYMVNGTFYLESFRGGFLNGGAIPFAATNGTWYQFYAIRSSSTGDFSIYQNNTLVQTNSGTIPGTFDGDATYGAQISGITNENFYSLASGFGAIRVYNKRLDATERTQNWDATRAVYGL